MWTTTPLGNGVFGASGDREPWVRTVAASVAGQDAVGEVLRVRRHLGFEQLEPHPRIAREQWSAATEDEGRHMDGHDVDETGLEELVARCPATHADHVLVARGGIRL